MTDEVVFSCNGLDLIDSPPLQAEHMLAARAILETNYGTEYSDEKMNNLFSLMLQEGWSVERFQRTLTWFRMNKSFPAWTEADWFSYSIPVHTYGWCLKMVKEGHDWKREIESYKLPNGQTVYKFRDGVDLPFEKRY